MTCKSFLPLCGCLFIFFHLDLWRLRAESTIPKSAQIFQIKTQTTEPVRYVFEIILQKYSYKHKDTWTVTLTALGPAHTITPDL